MDNEIIEKYRLAGKITAGALEFAKSKITEGYSLLKLADEIEAYIMEQGAKPAFPANISINDAAAHFSPDSSCELTFRRGDVAKIDCGAQIDGYIGDSAITVEIGTNEKMVLIQSSKMALQEAIEVVKDEIEVGRIGEVVENKIRSMGFRPIANLSGHQVSEYNLHAGLSVPNVGERFSKRIKEGMVIAIEPFSTNGNGYIMDGENGSIYQFIKEKNVHNESARKLLNLIKKDKNFVSLPFCERWCVKLGERHEMDAEEINRALNILNRSHVIRNYPVLREEAGGLVSQWEHTVLVTEDGCEVLTSR